MLATEPAAQTELAMFSPRGSKRCARPAPKASGDASPAQLSSSPLWATAFYLHFLRVSASTEKSIAVLPFENASDEKTNAYFASGIHDDLLVNLSKIANLKVISRNSVVQYRTGARDLRAIGRALGTRTVVEGSVRREGTRARINVQLINAEDGRQIWAENYDREMTDVFIVQREIAEAVASELNAALSAG